MVSLCHLFRCIIVTKARDTSRSIDDYSFEIYIYIYDLEQLVILLLGNILLRKFSKRILLFRNSPFNSILLKAKV